jgi:hypothetical protein
MRLKAISSFIASVLLIGFTIATGIIVYYFVTTLPRVQTAEISSGKIGKALSFDGMNDYVAIPSSSILSGLNTITVMAWVNPTKTTEGTIVSKHDNYLNREWQL